MEGNLGSWKICLHLLTLLYIALKRLRNIGIFVGLFIKESNEGSFKNHFNMSGFV